MRIADHPPNEDERIRALHRYEVLDTEPEEVFDEITRIASSVCGTPVSLVSFVDRARQWFKSKVGLDASETPRDIAFCSHAILQNDIFIVPDAASDERFADNPLVVGEPHVRFYAGVPLTTPDGHALGTLCVVDYAVRELDAGQTAALRALAAQVVAELELRRKDRDLEKLEQERQSAEDRLQRAREQQEQEALRKSEALFRSLSTSSPIGIFRTDDNGACEYVNPAWNQIAGLSSDESTGFGWLRGVHPDDRQRVESEWRECVAAGTDHEIVYRIFRGGRDEERIVRVRAVRVAGPPDERGWVGTVEDVTTAYSTADALRASEARLKRVLEGSNDGFWDWNIASGEVAVSERFASIIGCATGELQRIEDWAERIHPDDLARLRDELKDHLENRTAQIETEFRVRARGKWKWILDRGKVVARDAQGHAIRLAGTITDISTRKRAESELNRFFNLSVDMLGICGFDGIFRRVNSAFTKVLGYSAQELTSRRITDFVHPEDRPIATRLAVRLREGAAVENCEMRFVCSDGSTKWISWSSSPVPEEQLIYSIGRDVTSAKSIEEELRQSDARTRSIIDNSLGGVITTDGRGIIDSVNPATEAMFGYRADELVGQSVTMLVGEPGTPGDILTRLRKLALGRVTEVMGRRRSGELFPCELSLFEFSSGTGKYFAGHMLDISERHAVERMKSDFVATVSHELRTPLTSIRGALGLLNSGVMGPLPDDAAEMIAVAERSSVRLIALINDILDLEKLQDGNMGMRFTPVSVASFVHRAIESVSALAASEKVTILATGNDASVLVDEDRLTQVIVNLLSNAVRHSSPSSTVIVATQANGCDVLVSVIDHGTGISLEAQPRLFQRFQQIDNTDSRRKGGTGLGLAICKAIVEQHGGTIGVKSRLGIGSTFWLRLPVVQRIAGASDEDPLMLVVDGRGDLCSSVFHAVNRPVTLLRAANVEDALRILRALDVSVVVIDAPTADVSMMELLQQVRSAPRKIDVLVTGSEIALTPQQLTSNLTVLESGEETSLIRMVERLVSTSPGDVLIVGRNGRPIRSLDSYAAAQKISIRDVENRAEAASAIEADNPAVIIVDSELPDQERTGLIRDLQHSPNRWNTPVLMYWADEAPSQQRPGLRVGSARFVLERKGCGDLQDVLQQLLQSSGGAAEDENPGD